MNTAGRRFLVNASTMVPPAETPEVDERAFLTALASDPDIGGLELPFDGNIHPRGASYLADTCDPTWSFVVSTIPVTMAQVADSSFGLASPDSDGRRRAIDALAGLPAAISDLNNRLGHKAVIAVQVYSSPRRQRCDARAAAAFASSFRELCAWDWDGAALFVEHCDASVANHDSAKGFLQLTEEISALDAVSDQRAHGVTINWGRSAIETRSASGPLNHLDAVIDSGHRYALTYSGVSNTTTQFGPPWTDAHLPSCASTTDRGEPTSLLNSQAFSDCATKVECARTPAFLAVKIGARPKDASIGTRLATLRGCLTAAAAAHRTALQSVVSS